MSGWSLRKEPGERPLYDCEAQPPICRARVSNMVWRPLAYEARWDFDSRCLALGLPRVHWPRFDKLLGRELCVLFWSVATVGDRDEAAKVAQRWRQVSPEGRWWLYYMTSGQGAEAGHSPEILRGWRAALSVAFLSTK